MTEKNASKRCGAGINGSVVHYANGTPAIGANFPDMAGLVRDARSKNVSMGWYFNGARPLLTTLAICQAGLCRRLRVQRAGREADKLRRRRRGGGAARL